MAAKTYRIAILAGLLTAISAAHAGDYEMQRGITDGSPYRSPTSSETSTSVPTLSSAYTGDYEMQRRITDGSSYPSATPTERKLAAGGDCNEPSQVSQQLAISDGSPYPAVAESPSAVFGVAGRSGDAGGNLFPTVTSHC